MTPPENRPRLDYPGAPLLAEAVSATQSLEAGPSPADFARLSEGLRLAAERGLSLGGWVEAARTFFLLLHDAIDRVGRPLDLPEELSGPALESGTGLWLPLAPLLPVDDRVLAWRLCDLLHAGRVRRHYVETVVRAADAFVALSPVPAVRTAVQCVMRALELGQRDDRMLQLLDLVERWSDSESDLAFAREVRASLDVRCLDALRGASGTQADDLRRLWALHEEVSDVLGGDLVAREVQAGTREATEARDAARVLTSRAVATRAEILSRDAFLESWMEYEMARIEAGTGSAQSADRILSHLSERGFFPVETGLLRARLALAKRYPEDARSALERMATVLPWVRRDDGLQEPVRAAYREAGGDPETLGLAEPTQELVDRAARNREALAARAAAVPRPEVDQALAAFWGARQERFAEMLADLLNPSDIDAALTGVPWPREVRVDPGEAAACAVDELPGLTDALRDLMVAATRRPVPAREVAARGLERLEQRLAGGESFESLARVFPAYGQSPEVARRRVEAAVAGGQAGELVAVLDGYESLPGVPERLLLEAWERSRPVIARGPRWLENVRRGRRIWARLRGEAGRHCGELVRHDALLRLDDESARGAWEELVQAVLDTIPGDDDRERLFLWFQRRCEGPGNCSEMLRLGALLTRRIGPPWEAMLRGRIREAALSRMPELLGGRGEEDLRATLERLVDIAAGDPVVHQALADWFQAWRKGTGAEDPEASARVGEWLAARLDGEAAERVRHRTGQHLVSLLQASAGTPAQVAVMERLTALRPDDPELDRLLREARTSTADFRRMAVAIVLGSVVAVMLLWLLLR